MGRAHDFLLQWDSQPQEAVGLNPAIPLRPEFCFLGSNPSFDFAANRAWTLASAVTPRIGPAGRAIDFGAAAGAVSRAGTSTTAQTRCTFVIVATRTANNPFAFIARFSGSNSSFAFGCGDAGGINGGIVKGGVGNLATISIPVNVPHIIVASHRQDTGEYYCIARPLAAGSVLRASGTDTNVSTASNGTAQLNPNGGANTFAGEVALAYGSFDFLPEQVGRELLDNPWQLFAHQSISVPVSAGGPASYTLTAAAASFSLTGNAAGLRASRRLSAAAGSFALTGNAAGLYRGLRLTAAASAYTWTANSAGLLQGRRLLAAAAAYTLTGNAAALRAARKLSAAAASYTFTGNAAGLTYTPLGSYSLAAATGSYSLTGNSTGVRAARRLTASPGIFNLTGSAAQLLRGYRLVAAVQAYVWTGCTATLSKSQAYSLPATTATYAWTGAAAGLTYSGAPAVVRYASRSRSFTTGRELRSITTQRATRSITP